MRELKWLILSLVGFFEVFLGTVVAQVEIRPVGWVNDFAGVISSEYKSKLTKLITEVETKTTAEIVVATVKTTGGQSIDMYAVELFTRWGIGKKEKDNGVLLLAAIDDKKVWIETGYGVEGILPDGVCGEIYRSILKPNFQKGEFGKGFFLAVSAIADRIGKEYNVEITGAEDITEIGYVAPRSPCGAVLGPILFFLIFFLLIGGRMGFFLPLLLLGGMRRGYWGSGTFGGGGGFSGGFGGFGGGSCGGGGAGGSW